MTSRCLWSVAAIAILGMAIAGCGETAATPTTVASPDVQKATIGGKEGGSAHLGAAPGYKGGNDDARVGSALKGK